MHCQSYPDKPQVILHAEVFHAQNAQQIKSTLLQSFIFLSSGGRSHNIIKQTIKGSKLTLIDTLLN
jgi:hypothetical protein